MRRIQKIISWVLGVSILIVLMAFANHKTGTRMFNGLDIDIHPKEQVAFVRADEVENLVRKTYPFLDSLAVHEINIALLEETLDNHPSIQSSEVYSNLSGGLHIRVKQKEPIARIITRNSSYYLTNKGDSMKLSPYYSAKVPLITGAINRKNRAQIFNFLTHIARDDFYKDFFSGINISTDKTWELYPRAGNHKVKLGEYENITRKLEKLKTYYQAMVTNQNIHELKTINLQFTNQVVCQKHTKS